MQGTLRKMRAHLDQNSQVQYQLPVGEALLDLNPFIGKKLSLQHTGNIFCSHCGNKTKKSYSQGHCYVCMTKLASCDMCIMKPETCHFAQGTCREPEWGEQNCFVPHYVYLANTSAVKVGITRHTQLPTRWIDQGATQGLPVFKVASRILSGKLEVMLAKFVSDKTSWQAMLKSDAAPVDLKSKAAELIPQIEQDLAGVINSEDTGAIERLNSDIQTINYPVDTYPTKVKSHNFEKNPVVEGVLMGIKGQYLMFDTGVINIRKFTSYEVGVNA